MKARGGRPEYAPKASERRDVILYAACGMSEDDIARAIGVAPKTLRKHFAEEVATGWARKRAQNLKRLDAAAAKGNVSAQKYLDQRMGAAQPFVSEPAAQSRPPKLGKKEVAQHAAITAEKDTEWAGLLN